MLELWELYELFHIGKIFFLVINVKSHGKSDPKNQMQKSESTGDESIA